MTITEAKVIRLTESEPIQFAENSVYQPLVNGKAGGYPVFTGIQTAEPGYETPPHAHPYPEILHILEGVAEAWLVGEEDAKVQLEAGDTIVLPADKPHIFRVASDATLRLLGTHISPERIVHFTDGQVSTMGSSK
jgi:quercetin dioxygenase-like cupin family protein